MFILRALGIVVFFSVTVSVEGAPWDRSVNRQTPWAESVYQNSDRKERRESFFDSLVSSSQSKPARTFSIYDKSKSGGEGQSLNKLPWSTYAREWSGTLNSDFVWPVSDGKISSGFGVRGGQVHEGLDIVAQPGAAVRSVSDGRVVYAGAISGYGNTVVVYHGGGISTVYAHNRELLVSVDQIVQKGQSVATVGRSGKATGYHLHFEVRKKGRAMNPLKFSFQRDWSRG